MARTQIPEPVVIEPLVNRENLRELLALETEYPTLDFKSACEPGEKRASQGRLANGQHDCRAREALPGVSV
jgi:hypothetical protein